MVYGLNVKPEHGYYVNVKALDGDINKVEIADQTPDDGLELNSRYTWTAGRAVRPEFVPTKMEWLDRNRHPIPDFDNGLILNVSEKAKALIVQFEPGVHQFLPVDYFNGKGTFLEKRYFFVVCNRLDSLDRTHTTMAFHRNVMWVPASDLVRRGQPLPPGCDASVPAKMVFNNAQIGDTQFWCDKHLISGGPFISDKVAAALKEPGLTGLRLSENGVETV